jgi:hypothetical protein
MNAMPIVTGRRGDRPGMDDEPPRTLRTARIAVLACAAAEAEQRVAPEGAGRRQPGCPLYR